MRVLPAPSKNKEPSPESRSPTRFPVNRSPHEAGRSVDPVNAAARYLRDASSGDCGCEGAWIVAIGIALGQLSAATAHVPLSHTLTGSYSPFVPGRPRLVNRQRHAVQDGYNR